MAVEVFVHKMSEHMEKARIIRWLVNEGDRIEKYQVIMEVETDKATAELEAPASGVLKNIRPGAVDGAEVKVGETLAYIALPSEVVPELPPLDGTELIAAVAPSPPPSTVEQIEETGGVRATPVARRVARELGVDLRQVKGTGPQGRVNEEDVRAFAESIAQPALVPSTTPETEWLELTTLQRLTGERMTASVQNAPQFVLTLQADMTQAIWLREALQIRSVAETGDRLSFTSILTKVVAEVLTHHPRVNASYDNGRVKLHSQINIGIALGSETGLVVPVIKDADKKSLFQISTEITAFQGKAAQRRLRTDDLEGGTFTISNLGMYGVEQFNAILNPPQSAILAVGSVVKTPVGMPDETIALRPLITLTLTIDHRVLDGVQGAQFLGGLKELLETPFFML